MTSSWIPGKYMAVTVRYSITLCCHAWMAIWREGHRRGDGQMGNGVSKGGRGRGWAGCGGVGCEGFTMSLGEPWALYNKR